MKTFYSIIGAFALCIFSVAAFSGDLYVVGSVGNSSFDGSKSDLDYEVTSAGFTVLNSTFDDNDTGYKIQLGDRIGKNFAIEGGYINLGKLKYNATVTGGSAGEEIKASGFNIAGVGILPIDEQFSVFAKLGIIHSKVSARADAVYLGVETADSVSASEVTRAIGLGASYALSNSIAIRAEWEQFRSLGDADTGSGDVQLLSLGLAYNF